MIKIVVGIKWNLKLWNNNFFIISIKFIISFNTNFHINNPFRIFNETFMNLSHRINFTQF